MKCRSFQHENIVQIYSLQDISLNLVLFSSHLEHCVRRKPYGEISETEVRNEVKITPQTIYQGSIPCYCYDLSHSLATPLIPFTRISRPRVPWGIVARVICGFRP